MMTQHITGWWKISPDSHYSSHAMIAYVGNPLYLHSVCGVAVQEGGKLVAEETESLRCKRCVGKMLEVTDA